jgi:hypothetical protein
LFLSGKYKSVATDHAVKQAALRQRAGRATAGRRHGSCLGSNLDSNKQPRLHFSHRVSPHYGVFMNITLSLGPLVSLIAGILILVMPRLLNYIVALYLIIIGIIGIFGMGSSHF